MSSILKSLKKLESDVDRRLSSEESPAVNSRLTLRRQILSHRRIRIWFLGVITAGFLVAGGWFFTRSRPVPPLSVPPAPSLPAVMKPEKNSGKESPLMASSPIRPQAGLPAPQPPAGAPSSDESQTPGGQSLTSQNRQVIVSRTKGPPQHLARAEVPAAADIPDGKAMQDPGKSDSPSSGQGLEKNSAQEGVSPEMAPATFPPPSAKLSIPPAKSQAPEATPPAAEAKLPATGADGAELAPLPAEAGLKLEALAWSSAPESRFAVINSQIVREGGSVGGVKVERIEKEQVVLLKEGKLWQLRHRLQR